jgi:hypothetical protein
MMCGPPPVASMGICQHRRMRAWPCKPIRT